MYLTKKDELILIYLQEKKEGKHESGELSKEGLAGQYLYYPELNINDAFNELEKLGAKQKDINWWKEIKKMIKK